MELGHPERNCKVLAICGVAASLTAYLGSYAAVTIESFSRWELVVGIGPFILLLPIQVANRAAMKERNFFCKAFKRRAMSSA